MRRRRFSRSPKRSSISPPAAGATLRGSPSATRIISTASEGTAAWSKRTIIGSLRATPNGEIEAAKEQAIAEVIAEGTSVTYDMKPTRDDPTAVGTSEVAEAIIEKLGVRV